MAADELEAQARELVTKIWPTKGTTAVKVRVVLGWARRLVTDERARYNTLLDSVSESIRVAAAESRAGALREAAERAERMIFKGDHNSTDLVSMCAKTIAGDLRALAAEAEPGSFGSASSLERSTISPTGGRADAG